MVALLWRAVVDKKSTTPRKETTLTPNPNKQPWSAVPNRTPLAGGDNGRHPRHAKQFQESFDKGSVRRARPLSLPPPEQEERRRDRDRSLPHSTYRPDSGGRSASRQRGEKAGSATAAID